MGEEKVSRILKESREWFDVREKLPEEGREVVIRLCDESQDFGMDGDGNVAVAEDMKLGMYKDGKWAIVPPYPKFDYSPLSNGPNISEGVVVTHWAVPKEATENDIGEVEAWKSRFQISGRYKHFVIEIDKEHEELLYRACSWGAAALRGLVGETEESMPLIGILWDIQALMDQDACIKHGEIIEDGGLRKSLEIIDRANRILKVEE